MLTRTERHQIRKGDPAYPALDHLCFASKNLYNAGNYEIRQRFFAAQAARALVLEKNRTRPKSKKLKLPKPNYLGYFELDRMLRNHDAYLALPAKVAQVTLRRLGESWTSWFKAIADYRKNPEKYEREPRIPGYLDKAEGRAVVTYTNQAVTKSKMDKTAFGDSQGEVVYPLHVSGITGAITTTKLQHNQINCVRLVPQRTRDVIVIEIVTEIEEVKTKLNRKLHAGVDVGLNVLAAVTSDKPGFQPVLVNGRPLKSINQFYNYKRAELYSKLPEPADENETRSSARLRRLSRIRHDKIQDYLHKTSRAVVNLLVRERIGNLVIGKNDGWKTEINIGSRNNQNFVCVPHARFVEMLTYKAEAAGIVVTLTEESYTSRCSFLDLEPMEKREVYAGTRKKRGLFVSRVHGNIHADVNGSYNTIRKVVPKAFRKGIEVVLVQPKQLLVAA